MNEPKKSFLLIFRNGGSTCQLFHHAAMLLRVLCKHEFSECLFVSICFVDNKLQFILTIFNCKRRKYDQK